MDIMGLFDYSFEEKIKCEAEMYADLGRVTFNNGMKLTAYTYLTYAEKLHSSPQAKTLLGFLESSDSLIIKEEEILKCFDLKNERRRLINNTKKLLKLIENGNTDENEYKNIRKIDLNPKKCLDDIFKSSAKSDSSFKFEFSEEKLEKIISNAKLLFTDDQLNPYIEILKEKKKKLIKPNEYNFKSENLNINNLEDAEKCIDKAEKAIIVGQYEKAKRMLLKAERLYHTIRGKELLQQVLNVKETQSSVPNIPNGSENDDLKKTPKQNIMNPENKVKQKTEDSIAAIQRIMEARNNYDILGVSEESSIAEINKAFRKLTMVLHPDKTKASGATEAFKAVTTAKEALVRMKKRK